MQGAYVAVPVLCVLLIHRGGRTIIGILVLIVALEAGA
jgi:hypothetical protein